MHLDNFFPFYQLNIDLNPLNNKDQLFNDVGTNQITQFKKNVLSSSIINLFESRNLIIDKVIIWQWNLNEVHLKNPHTDGDLTNKNLKRFAGINWVISGQSSLDFWKIDNNDKFKVIKNKNSFFTEWYLQDKQPLASWNGKIPSLVNPQVPHRVRKTGNDNIRKSVVISFNNIQFHELVEKLKDIFYE